MTAVLENAGKDREPGQAIVFRADAGVDIGTGHVMRCLALANELLNRNIPVLFVTASYFPALESRLVSSGISLFHICSEPGSIDDAQKTCGAAADVSALWVIVDGYTFGSPYQAEIKKRGFSLACIDDYAHAGTYHADLILNQNLYASEKMYPNRPEGSCLLLGPQYALIREEIAGLRKDDRTIPKTGRKILVTLGGSDPNNLTHDVIKTLLTLPAGSYKAKIIAGGCNPHVPDLIALTGNTQGIEIFQNTENMGELYSWADLAVVAGGTTTFECACLGLPMITLAIAENQVPVSISFEEAGAAVNLHPPGNPDVTKLPELIRVILSSSEKRRLLSEHAATLVDGKGALRVADNLSLGTVRLRKAVLKDCAMIYNLSNEPLVRSVSFNIGSIHWEEHERWFMAKISDPNVWYFIVLTDHDVPVGQVRYEINDRDATISISIMEGYRGKNIGPRAMQCSANDLFKKTGVEAIHAYIKRTNPVSCRAFIKAGYKYMGEVLSGTEKAYHLILKKR